MTTTPSKRFRGVSTIVSTVIVISMVFVIAAIVSPFMFDTTQYVTNQTSDRAHEQIECQELGYDFDRTYGTFGLFHNFTPAYPNDTLSVRVENTGSISLYGFSFEILYNSTTSGLEIVTLEPSNTTQRTIGFPLLPGRTAILSANFTRDINGTLQEVKLLNSVCPGTTIELDV